MIFFLGFFLPIFLPKILSACHSMLTCSTLAECLAQRQIIMLLTNLSQTSILLFYAEGTFTL